jgi:mono/diheme cytochrome c family protein
MSIARRSYSVLAVGCVLAALLTVACSRAKKAGAAPPETKTTSTPAKSPPTKDIFVETIRPIFAEFCIGCHGAKKMSAGLSLEPFKSSDSARKNPDLWETVKELVESKQMPPKGKPQPTDAQRKAIVAWIDSVAIKVDCGMARDPGRPTIRRLNKTEFNNTIRDLVGVDFKPADNFPADDVGYGFDNIGDVLSMPPILLEKYLTAAESIIEKAIVVPKPIVSVNNVRRPQNVGSTLGESSKQGTRIYLHSNGAAFFQHEFPHTGEYVIRARAYGDQAGTELPKMEIRFDGKLLTTHNVDALVAKPKYYDTRLQVQAGRHDLRFAYINDFTDKDAKDDKKKDRNLSIEVMEIEGPFKPVPPPLPESHKLILVAQPMTFADREPAARKIIETFATRAYRRPLKADELARLMKLFKFADQPTEPFEQTIKHPLKAVLVSPHFLFRIERDAEPNNPQAVHPVGQHELATRLSYFLWSSMPDDELTKLADAGKLSGATLEAQVRRMLKDKKASALVENFTGQWLMLRTLATMTPDKATFRNFDPALRSAMIRETELYFDHVMRDDRSVLEFLDSNYTFANERLARHYGLQNVSGSEFKKVTLVDRSRGGLLTHGSILTVTSNPTRTSPVKRGKWILENILGTPPPAPPPDVPELEESKAELTGTLRQRMEKHRENPSCATCHAKLDPLGFGLENFDAVGAFRESEGKTKIDASGVLPDGAKFDGPEQMRKVLLGKADLFRRNLAEKMLTYALGRGLEYYDRCAVDDVVTAMKKGDDRFSALMIAVVKSDPFLKRRGAAAKKD